jgi:hypothetical protein
VSTFDRTWPGRLSRFAYGCGLIATVATLLTVGAIQSARFLWASALVFSHGQVPHLATWARTYLWSRPDGWLTAIATALLFWATLELTRLTRRQTAGASPVLHYTLSAGRAVPGGPSYPQAWEAVDKNTPQLSAYTSGEPAYVDLHVVNEQRQPYGIAIGLRVTVGTTLGSRENVDYQPSRLEREVVIPVVGAGDEAEARIFNVGGVPNYVVRIKNVEYTDMFKRIRHAAYGTGELSRYSHNLSVSTGDTIFMPTKRELS